MEPTQLPEIEVHEEPGLAAKLAQGRADSAVVADVAELVDQMTPDEPLARELTSLLRPAQRVEPTEALGAFWEQLKRIFAPTIENIVGSEEVMIPIAVFWLDVPGVDGATATVTVTGSSEHSVSAEIKVLGIGGGPTATATVKSSLKYSTPKPEILVVSVPALIQDVQVLRAGEVLGRYQRMSEFRWDNKRWMPQPLGPPVPLAGDVIEERFDEGGGNFTPDLGVEKGTVWEMSKGLNLPKLGVDLTVKSKGAYKSGVSYSYALPRGHSYIARRPRSVPCWFWEVEVRP